MVFVPFMMPPWPMDLGLDDDRKGENKFVPSPRKPRDEHEFKNPEVGVLATMGIGALTGFLTGGLQAVFPGYVAALVAGALTYEHMDLKGFSSRKIHSGIGIAATFTAAALGLVIHSFADFESERTKTPSAIEECLFPAKPVISCAKALTGSLFRQNRVGSSAPKFNMN